MPLIGDDGKSQFGGTIIHRALAMLMYNRGVHLNSTYQINYAGNTDFANLMARGEQAQDQARDRHQPAALPGVTMSTGFTFVELMKDRKTMYLQIQGGNFGNAPLLFEAKLEVEDSANLAGIMVEIIRHMRLALDRKVLAAS